MSNLLIDIGYYLSGALFYGIEIGGSLLFLLLIIGGIYGALSAYRDEKRGIALLSQMPCPHCGAIYGIKAAQRAAKTFRAQIAQIRPKYGRSSVQVFPRWPIECPVCQFISEFNPKENTLAPLPQHLGFANSVWRA